MLYLNCLIRKKVWSHKTDVILPNPALRRLPWLEELLQTAFWCLEFLLMNRQSALEHKEMLNSTQIWGQLINIFIKLKDIVFVYLQRYTDIYPHSSYPGWNPGPGRVWVVCHVVRRPWRPRRPDLRSRVHSGPLGWPAAELPQLQLGILRNKDK